MDGKQFQSLGQIVAESWIDSLRIMFRLQLSFVDANQLLSFAGFFPETIVGDPVKPGRKTRFAAKAAQVFVSLEKRFLGQVVRERDVGSDQVPQQAAHARLMIADQLGKGVVVVINKNARNEVCIC